MNKARIDIEDYEEVLSDIVKLEDNNTYLIKVPNTRSAEDLAKAWNGLSNRPKCRIIMVPKDMEVYRKINEERHRNNNDETRKSLPGDTQSTNTQSVNTDS